jgi:DNA mismatch endonuclease (patch repair protein)
MSQDYWRAPTETTMAPVSDRQSWAMSTAVRNSMRANKSRDTGPEMAVRRLLFHHGLRYRVAYRALPGSRRTVDIAFPRQKIAILIDGCFWHGCPEHLRPAVTHADFWAGKIAATRQRDLETSNMLEQAGWQVLRFWEHEDSAQVARRIEETVAGWRTPRAVP